MATWDDVKAQLARYEQATARDHEVVLRWKYEPNGRTLAVVVRLITAFGAEWLRVTASIAHATHIPLDALLRRAEAVVGAVVIEGQRCVLRETVCISHVAPVAVHALIATVGRQAGELAALARSDRELHPYAYEFCS